MEDEVQVETSRTGLVVRPPDPAEMAVLYLHGDLSPSAAPEQALDIAGHLALRTGATVVCARYRGAGQCSGLQAGGEGPRGRAAGPERALTRPVLLLDVAAAAR